MSSGSTSPGHDGHKKAKSAAERAATNPGGRSSFVEPTLLCALAIRPAHGYELKKTVEELTEGLVEIDLPGAYRLLRRLEGEGLVVSAWAQGEAGPQRRTYSLTSEGWALLEDWRAFLSRQRRVCNLTMSAIETVVDVWASESCQTHGIGSSDKGGGVAPGE